MVRIILEGNYTSTGKYSASNKIEVEDTDTEEKIEETLKRAKELFNKTDQYMGSQYIEKNYNN